MTRPNPFGFDPLTPELLDRYLSGEATAGEAAEVRAWAAQDPRRAVELEILRRSVDSLGGRSGVSAEKEAAWAELTAMRYRSQAPGVTVARAHPVAASRLALRASRIAGIAAAAVIIAGGIKYLAPSDTPSGPETRTYATKSGQRASITLADGSSVTLAPATTIQVTNRQVTVDGEAIFKVTKHTGSPFLVRSVNSITRVLGTTFSVRRYATDSVTRVAVHDGKVELNSFVLSANSVGIVDRTGAVLMRANANVSDMLSWASGALTVRDRKLGEVVPDLERWYGIKIQLASEALTEQRISGSFTESSPHELRKALEFILGARAELKGEVLTVYAK